MSEGPNIAMQNFMMNTLRGMGTGDDSGGGGGGGAGIAGIPGLLGDANVQPQEKIKPVPGAGQMPRMIIDSLKGFVQSLTPTSFLDLINPPSTPFVGKIANILGVR
jgi:hypothetical protein